MKMFAIGLSVANTDCRNELILSKRNKLKMLHPCILNKYVNKQTLKQRKKENQKPSFCDGFFVVAIKVELFGGCRSE